MAIFYVYLGQETGFAGWISSYVVILNLDTERGAARFPAIFWVTITMLRFVFAGIPGKSSTKLKGLIFLQIVCYFIATCMFYSSHEYLAAYWTSITIGIAYSSMYPMANGVTPLAVPVPGSQSASLSTLHRLLHPLLQIYLIQKQGYMNQR